MNNSAEEKQIVSVSIWDGKIDWAEAADHISGAMIKASQSCSRNSDRLPFARDFSSSVNIIGATENGVRVGVYHFLDSCEDKHDAKFAARKFLASIERFRHMITLPVAVDVESPLLPKDPYLMTYLVLTICNEIKEAGYEPMICTTTEFMKKHRLCAFDIPLWLCCCSQDEYEKYYHPNLRFSTYMKDDENKIRGFNGPVMIGREIGKERQEEDDDGR